VVADGLLAIEPGGQIRAAERYLERAIRREQVDEAFGVLIQQHFPPSLQDLRRSQVRHCTSRSTLVD